MGMGKFAGRYGSWEFVLAISGEEDPTDAEWDEYVALCRQARVNANGDRSKIVAVSFTDGGSPTAAQRRKIAALYEGGGKPPHTLVVTESALARGAVTAISWLAKTSLTALAPEKLGDWLTTLGMEPAAIGTLVADLRSEGHRSRAMDRALGALQRVTAA